MAKGQGDRGFKVSVPLGDKQHPNEKRGTSKVVLRKLAKLEGEEGKRTGLVFWRGQYRHVIENPERPGHFVCKARAKKSELPPEVPKVTKVRTPKPPKVTPIVKAESFGKESGLAKAMREIAGKSA